MLLCTSFTEGASQEEIVLTVRPEKSLYMVGEPVFLEVILSNQTDRPLSAERFNLQLSSWACSDLIFQSPSPSVRTPSRGCNYAGSCLGGLIHPDHSIGPGESRIGTVFLNQWLIFDEPGTYPVEVTSQPTVRPPLKASLVITVEQGRQEELDAVYRDLVEELSIDPAPRPVDSADWRREQQILMALTDWPNPHLESVYLEWTRRKDLLPYGVEACSGLCTEQCLKRLAELVTAAEGVQNGPRTTAIRGIGACGNRDYVSLLHTLAQHPDRMVSGSAIVAYGQLGGSDAVPFLERLSRSADPTIRGAAVGGLRDSESREAVSVLISLLNDPDHFVRQGAVNALESLTHRFVRNAGNDEEPAKRWSDWWKEAGDTAPIFGIEECAAPREEIPVGW